jgi:hypothetical protein
MPPPAEASGGECSNLEQSVARWPLLQRLDLAAEEQHLALELLDEWGREPRFLVLLADAQCGRLGEVRGGPVVRIVHDTIPDPPQRIHAPLVDLEPHPLSEPWRRVHHLG